jgi:hypothetical protein
VCAIFSAKTARNFLLEFAHAQVPFSQIVVKRDPKIGHKPQVGSFMGHEAVKQITGRRLSEPAALSRLAVATGNALISPVDELLKQSQDPIPLLAWQLALAYRLGRLDHGPGGPQQAHHLPSPPLAGVSLINGLQFP